MTDRAPDAGPAAVRQSRWIKIALVASVALNLLILGTIGGSIWAVRHGPQFAARYSGPHLLGFTRTLPEDRRFEIWKVTRKEMRALRPKRKELRRARAEAREILAAEPFDKEKFAEAQARVFEVQTELRREAQSLFLSIAEVLTPQERVAFTKWQPLRRAERSRRDTQSERQ